MYTCVLIFQNKGKRIKVEKAPDPDEIIWENLEVTGISKRLRRFSTFLISVVLLIISFAAIIQSSRYKGIFSSKVPSAFLCSQGIPSLYGAYSNITDYRDFKLVRPNPASSLDAQCNLFIPNSFYAVYSNRNNPDDTVANYDFQVEILYLYLCMHKYMYMYGYVDVCIILNLYIRVNLQSFI
jgi:hypothetical protein